MDGYAIMGDVYLSPDSASSGGTLLRGLDPSRPIRLVPPAGVKTERFGGSMDAVRSYRDGTGVWTLILPCVGHNANAVKMALQSYTADGLTAQSSGTGTQALGAAARDFSVVVRPRDNSEDYWFCPRLQLFETSELSLNRSRVEFTVLDDTLLVMVPARPYADVPAVTMGDSSAIDAAIAAAGGEEMAYLRKKITTAELVALGASTTGQISMGTAMPAGAVPIAFTARNRGTAFTSSAGSVTQLDAQIVADGQTVDAFADGVVDDLMTAGKRGGKALAAANATATVAPWPNGAWTPRVRFTCNRNLGTLTGGDDGIEILILYHPVTLPS